MREEDKYTVSADTYLLDCPFCGSNNINDKGYGISCRTCGVWVGGGSDALKFGGYKKLWNTRPALPARHSLE